MFGTVEAMERMSDISSSSAQKKSEHHQGTKNSCMVNNYFDIGNPDQTKNNKYTYNVQKDKSNAEYNKKYQEYDHHPKKAGIVTTYDVSCMNNASINEVDLIGIDNPHSIIDINASYEDREQFFECIKQYLHQKIPNTEDALRAIFNIDSVEQASKNQYKREQNQYEYEQDEYIQTKRNLIDKSCHHHDPNMRNAYYDQVIRMEDREIRLQKNDNDKHTYSPSEKKEFLEKIRQQEIKRTMIFYNKYCPWLFNLLSGDLVKNICNYLSICKIILHINNSGIQNKDNALLINISPLLVCIIDAAVQELQSAQEKYMQNILNHDAKISYLEKCKVMFILISAVYPICGLSSSDIDTITPMLPCAQKIALLLCSHETVKEFLLNIVNKQVTGEEIMKHNIDQHILMNIYCQIGDNSETAYICKDDNPHCDCNTNLKACLSNQSYIDLQQELMEKSVLSIGKQGHTSIIVMWCNMIKDAYIEKLRNQYNKIYEIYNQLQAKTLSVSEAKKEINCINNTLKNLGYSEEVDILESTLKKNKSVDYISSVLQSMQKIKSINYYSWEDIISDTWLTQYTEDLGISLRNSLALYYNIVCEDFYQYLKQYEQYTNYKQIVAKYYKNMQYQFPALHKTGSYTTEHSSSLIWKLQHKIFWIDEDDRKTDITCCGPKSSICNIF